MESPISLRIPADVLQKIDAEGKRGTVINHILREYYAGAEEQRVVAKKTESAVTITAFPDQWGDAYDRIRAGTKA